MKKILVAYDGREAGRRALEMAARLAIAFSGRVDVVSVVPAAAAAEGDAAQPAVEHARELVEARGILRRHGLEAGLIEPSGEPAQTIERLASERGYDTIVVGGNRAGRNGGHAWTDSVTAHVAANAKADVVVARRILTPYEDGADE